MGYFPVILAIIVMNFPFFLIGNKNKGNCLNLSEESFEIYD